MPEKHEDAKMPPIPDGGLSESMPDWLRRPPAWRTLKDADVVQTEPVHAAELPEPDTSVIDPRTFLTDDDLPLWLRNMGRSHRASREQAGDDETIADEQAAVDQVEQPVTNADGPAASPPEPGQPATSSSRFVPRTPPIAVSGPLVGVDRTASMPIGTGQPSSQRWWQGPAMVVLLAVLLVVALVTIAILAVV